MRKLKYLIILTVLLIGLLGCQQLFEFNLFSSLDHANIPDASKLKSMPTNKALDLLEEEADSDQFFEDLAGDDTKKSGLKDYLDDIWGPNSDVDTTEKQRAALIYADIELKTTGGDDLVNNLVNTLLSDNPPDNFEEFWDNVVPAEAQTEEGMIAMLDGLLGAYDAYDAFGDTLSDNDPPEGTNMGEVAQNAVVSFYLNSFAEANGIDTSQDTAGEELYNLLTGDTPPSANEMPDPSTSVSLTNILSAAGLSNLFSTVA